MKYELTEEQMQAIAEVHTLLEIAERDMQSLFREDSVIRQPISQSLNILTPIVNEYTDRHRISTTWPYIPQDGRNVLATSKRLGITNSEWTLDVDLDAKHPWPSMKYVKVEDTKVEIRGKTWADLWLATEIAIGRSVWMHRYFIENYYPSSEPFTLRVVLGS